MRGLIGPEPVLVPHEYVEVLLHRWGQRRKAGLLALLNAVQAGGKIRRCPRAGSQTGTAGCSRREFIARLRHARRGSRVSHDAVFQNLLGRQIRGGRGK